MITFFRRMFSSKLGVVLAMLFVGVIALAFGLADINAPGGTFSGGGDTLVTVDGENVDDQRVSQMMTRALQAAREEQPGIDMNAFVAAGGLERAIEGRITEVVLGRFAVEHDIMIGKRLVDAAIATAPIFRGLSGEFDEQTFRSVLAQQNLTEAEVRTDLAQQALVRLILGPVTGATRVPEGVARPYAQLLVESRNGYVSAVPSRAMPPGSPPSAAELNAFYQSNLNRYTLPERRAVRYAVFTVDQLNVPEPSAEQISAYYEEHSDQYGGNETRTLRQIILPDEAQARAFYNQVRGGESFSAAASARGFSDSATTVTGASQASFTRETSQAVASAAFAATDGGLTQPVRSGLGWHVVQVSAINRRDAIPLASVRGEITTALREQLTNEALAEFYLAIENAIDDGASFEEIVEARGLTIVATPPVTPQGVSPERPAFSAGPDLPAILETAFTMDEDEDPLVIPLEENQRYAMVDVVSVARSAPQPLAAIRQGVAVDFMLDRASKRARTVARQIATKVNNGMSVAQAVSEADVDLPAPQRAQASRAQISQMGANAPAPLRLMFRMAENTAKLVRLPQNEGWFVVVLDEIVSNIEAVTDELVAQTQQEFSRVTAQEYAEQFVNAIRTGYEVERDEDAIQALSDRLTGRAR